MDDSRHSFPCVNQETEAYDGNNELPSRGNEADMASPPHTDQDTSQNSDTYMMSPPHTQDTESYDGDKGMPSLNSEAVTASQGSKTTLNGEKLSEDSETDTASQGSNATLNDQKLSEDSETDTASEGFEASLDDKTNEPRSSCSSKETEKAGASFGGQDKNEGFSKNHLIENDDHANKNNADRDLPDANNDSSDSDNYSSEEFPEIFMCDICFKKFPDKEQLWGHKRIQSPPITYNCEECHKRFYIECDFEYHKSFEHTPDMFSPEKQK